MVVVNNKRKEVLNLLHSEIHTGVVRMKMLARSVVWWLGIDQDIENFVNKCLVCQMTRNSKIDNTTSKWPDTNFPLQRVHIDLFFFSGQTFLIMMDSYSKYMDIHKLNISNGQNVIKKIKKFCAYFGLIKEIVSDNGPPFNSSEFINWCERNHIKVTKSPPYHPASNGTAERAVQTAKVALKKIIVENNNKTININDGIINFLFTYRTTPSTVTHKSPTDLMFNYRPRTPITVLNKNIIELKAKNKNENVILNKDVITIFESGENVYYKNHVKDIIKWIPCKIVNKKSVYVYTIELGGRIRTAHVNQLRKRYKQRELGLNNFEEDFELQNNNEENVELQNVELQNHNEENVELQNVELENHNENVELQNVELENNNEENSEVGSNIRVPSERPKRDIRLPSRFKDHVMY